MESSSRCAKRSHVGRWWLHSSRFHVQPVSTLFPFCKDSMKRTETSARHRLLAFRKMKRKIPRHSSRQYGLTFPVLLDDTSTYEVSNAYGLTNVPTIFWIAQDGEIEISSVGWIRKDMDRIESASCRASRGRRQAAISFRRTDRRLPRWLRVEKLARGRGQERDVRPQILPVSS